jgi:hypothetical protein
MKVYSDFIASALRILEVEGGWGRHRLERQPDHFKEINWGSQAYDYFDYSWHRSRRGI